MKDQTLTFQEHAFSVNNILKATGLLDIVSHSFLDLACAKKKNAGLGTYQVHKRGIQCFYEI